MLESKLYDDTEIQTILNYISEKEGVPVKWLFFNIGTDKHVGTRIPARLINPKEKGDYINAKAFEVNEKIYYYAGYDLVHRLGTGRNFYYGTKSEILENIKKDTVFIETATKKEINEYIEHIFKVYTEPMDKRWK